MDTAQIAQIIRDRAVANGVDPAVLLRFGQIESSLNPNAGSDSSSAKGLFQFTDGTAKAYGLTNPYDPTANADAAARLMRDNAKALGTNDPTSLYLAHFAGLGGAQKLRDADPSTPAGDVLGAAAVKANPFLARMTVDDLRNWAAGKMGGAGSDQPTSQPQPQQTAQVTQTAPQTATAGAGAALQTGAQDQPDASDAALAAFRQIMAQQTEPLQAPQMNLLRAAINPRRTVTLG